MKSFMHTKRFNIFFFKWVQSRFGAIQVYDKVVLISCREKLEWEYYIYLYILSHKGNKILQQRNNPLYKDFTIG